MAKSYESLIGAVGRSVFYRPDRQPIRELLSRDATPKVVIEGEAFPVFDVSMNGVSLLLNGRQSEWQVGQELRLSLLLYNEEVYEGAARVARIERGSRGSQIGLGLTNGFLDLPAMQRRDDEKKLERSLCEGPAAVERLVPADYQAIVGRIGHFFQYHRRSLDYHEQRLRAEGAGEPGILELTARAADALLEPRRRLETQAAIIASRFLEQRNVLLAAKEFTETLLVPLIHDVPHDSRAYYKPLGYPGDYQLMSYYYNDTFEGDSVFARAMHKVSLQHPLCAGVRGRKDLVVELIAGEHRRIVESSGEESDFRIVSLGCGPAREASEYIAKVKGWPGRMAWTLIDPEEKALSAAYRASQKEISKWGSRCDLHLLNLAFGQMLTEGLPLREPGSQHFIYAAGVFDYLKKFSAQKLIGAMYDLLAPGGLIAVGNAVAPNDFFWSAEMLTDWSLIYRNEEEMRELTRKLPESTEIEVVKEPNGAFFFLLVRKP